METLEVSDMEDGLRILDAITHAVRAVDRRRDGLASVAAMHSKASATALSLVRISARSQ